ncbi:MAG: DUF1837 domain-containing protein [Actinobacteria bacterium]|nr:DUF1837 domain-containing protein [Actinomycetota bacterium]MCA1721165.1 DUF1837 domain-containing protein [Actinomycetota bacterium]
MTAATDDDVVRRALGDDAWLRTTLANAARGRAQNVDAHLHHFAPPARLAGTRSTCRAHFVVCGPDGKPRIDQLTARLAAEIVDFCIPRGRIEEAKRAYLADRSTMPLGRLQNEARSLFTHLEKSGEGGELLLYLLLEVVLGIPQILCKMPLKTSSAMHVHGADGVHAAARDDGGLAIYWGESKLHANVTDAVRECLDSVSKMLVGPTDARGRDMLLLRDHAQLEDNALTNALRAFFDDDDPRSARVEFRGACLVGFDQDDYPDVRSGGADVEAAVRSAVAVWAETVRKRVQASQLASIEIEVFCVPFPSVQGFRDAIGSAIRG